MISSQQNLPRIWPENFHGELLVWGFLGGGVGCVWKGHSPSYGNDASVHPTVASQPSRLLFGWAGWRNTILLKRRAFKWRQTQSASITEALFTLMTHCPWLPHNRGKKQHQWPWRCWPSTNPALSPDFQINTCMCVYLRMEREREDRRGPVKE